jgi:hypothetical protein
MINAFWRHTVAGSLLKTILAALVFAGALNLAVDVPAAEAQAKPKAKSGQPLRGKSYYGRRGGYSVRKSDVTGNTFRQDPTINARTSGAPLQGDFFWEQPTSPIGGNTSYMH